MSSTQLTPYQMAEIVFQRPSRITKGVLDNRSAFERMRDSVMVYSAKRPKSARPNRMRQRLVLAFYNQAGDITEHPRSLRRAALELKAIGFSNAQIEEIKMGAYIFSICVLDRSKLGEELKRDMGGDYAIPYEDRAFLGVAAFIPAAAGADSKTGVGQGAIRNSIYSEQTEPVAFDSFVGTCTPQPWRPSLPLAPVSPSFRLAHIVR